MDEQEQLEIELLKKRQLELEEGMTALLRRLTDLEARLKLGNSHSPAATVPIQVELPPPPTTAVTPVSKPPPLWPHAPIHVELRTSTAVKPPGLPAAETKSPEVPAPRAPLHLQSKADAVPQRTEADTGPSAPPRAVAPPIPPRIAAVPMAGASGPQLPRSGPVAQSFEMRLGTYWLVRIGVVMVLTGLVFFGNLAYQKFISELGPGGKLALLYLASFALLGAGAWWQRKAVKESLRNYAQVLFAGGLAAVYFTTYAAYHLPQVKVIASALLDGVLLLVWAGVIAWIADRKKSEVLAVFGIGLAYYSSIITHVGHFTLYSNLVLSLAALAFLIRNRWAAVSLLSLAATYVGYGIWRFFEGGAWHWASPEQGLWQGTYFLMSYWCVFTASVFLSKAERFAGENRAGFLTLNNGAFFGLFLLTMLQVQTGGFWKFMLSFGTVLLAMAGLASRFLSTEPIAKNSYLTQGLLLVTVGLITKFAGLQLALLLAAESVVLLTFGQRQKNLVLLAGAYISAGLSVGWGMDGLKQFEPSGIYLGVGLGALILVNALLVHYHIRDEEKANFRPRVAYFSALALAIWWAVIYDNCAQGQFPVIVAVAGLVLTFSVYALRLPEVTILAQGYLISGLGAWFFNVADTGEMPGWWKQVLLIAVLVGVSHWWQRQETVSRDKQLGKALLGIYAAALVGLVYVWLRRYFELPGWMAMSAVVAVAMTIYAYLTRWWLLAACSQFFLVASAGLFALHLARDSSAWRFPLVPIAAVVALAWSTRGWFWQHPDADQRVREPLLALVQVYLWAATAMGIAWVCVYIPERHRVWVLAAIGFAIFLLAGARKKQETFVTGAAFSVTGLVLLWSSLAQGQNVNWRDLLLVVALFAQQRFIRHLPERYRLENTVHPVLILSVGVTLWFYLSRWVLESVSGFYLTASWSVLALVMFGFGVVFRERMYRWIGLGVLACSLGRVVIFDVWKLETVYRVLSFMALGIALLVLGFFYTKYQEKLREWL